MHSFVSCLVHCVFATKERRRWPYLPSECKISGAYFLWAALVIFYGGSSFAQQPATNQTARLPRTNLLLYRDLAGEIKPVKSKGDWQKRRAEILVGMQQIMGPLPGKEKRCPLEVTIEEQSDCGSYVRRSLSYASEAGGRVPAYLLIPKRALEGHKKFPAVLTLHPTDMEFGHRVLVEQLRSHYRAYAAELAERGYVVLAPAYPLMAKYQPELERLGYRSGTMKAIWDNIRGLDLLESLPMVKKGEFGAVGHSLGGHNALYTAVFDERIKVVVSSCGFDSYLDYKDGDIRGWTSQRYMPRLLEFRERLIDIPFDFHELLGTLAPRAIFINAPLGDSNFKWRSVDEIVRAAAPIYRFYKRQENLQVEHPDCGHEFPAETRERAYRFLDANLRR